MMSDHSKDGKIAESQAEIVALRAENKALNEAVDNARHDSWGQAGVIEKLEARVAELEAENEHMRGIFKDLSDWLNNGAIIKATDPALPVVIGPELTTNLHIQGPLARKEGE